MASEIRVNKLNSQTGVGTITLSPTGVDISGVTTVSTLRSNIGIFSGTITGEHHGDGSNLTGVASTENIRTNTNATFLQNVSVVGTSTVTGNIVPSSDSATDIGTNSVRFQNAYVDTYHGSAASLTAIPAANIVGVATAGFERSGGFGGGKLLKIHYAATNTATTVTTPTRADTGLTVTFTPAALGSTFYIQANQFGLNGVSNDQALFNLYLMRSIDGGTASEIEEYHYLGNYTTNDRAYWGSPLGYKDTPTYTSGQTLNYHIEVGFYTGNYNLNYIAQVGQAKSSIFVYEFGA